MTSRAGKRKSKGFTLIELLIAITIVGLIVGLAVGQINKMTQKQLRSSASKLSSTIRYLYNKAISDGLTLRLVIDMEEQKYWVEGASGTVALKREGEEEGEERREKREERSEEKKEKGDEEPVQSKKGSFTPESSYLLKPVTLPKGVYFKDVYAEHQIAPLGSGRAYVHFFPQGYAERAVINLRDRDDEHHYSLVVNPVSGAVEVKKGYKEAEIER